MATAAEEYLRTNFTFVRELKASPDNHITIVSDQGGAFFVLKETKRTGLPYSLLQKLSHPALPQIYYVNETAAGTTILEEYINGKTLDILRTLKPLSEEQVQAIAIQICQALSFLHAHKILHRDIKPSNIIQQPDGHVKLIDFDAARTIHNTAESDTRLLGTKGFAPPEQYGFAQTDARSDIYALGQTMAILLGPTYKGRLLPIIKKATQLDAAKRYRDAAAMGRALQQSKGRYVLSRYFLPLFIFIALSGSMWFYWSKQNTTSPNLANKPAAGSLPDNIKLASPKLEKRAANTEQKLTERASTISEEPGTLPSKDVAKNSTPKQTDQIKPADIPIKDSDFTITYSTNIDSSVLPLLNNDYEHALHINTPQSLTLFFTVTNNSNYAIEQPYLMFYPGHLAFGGTSGIERGKAAYVKLADVLPSGGTASAQITFHQLELLQLMANMPVTVISNSFTGPRGNGEIIFKKDIK